MNRQRNFPIAFYGEEYLQDGGRGQHRHFRKSITGLVVERFTGEMRQRCPVPLREDAYYIAHLPPSPRYTLGKSPNEARKAYIRLKREGLEANGD